MVVTHTDSCSGSTTDMDWQWQTMPYAVSKLGLKYRGVTKAVVAEMFGLYSVYGTKANKFVGTFETLDEAKAWAQAVCRMEVSE